MNEEEVKVRVILPWLAEAGIDNSDLQFEKSFSVRLGRQSVTVGSAPSSLGGRLDILVRRESRNLFIIETKAATSELSDADRDQAISYARLVHPIAPYALVTNGRQFKLYDTLTKAEIAPSSIRLSGMTLSLPEEDLVEAQSVFLRLNRENLVALCRGQVASELRLIKGSIADGKKYVPALHVPRDSLDQAVEKFFSEAQPGLLLVGESGQGKTCALCALAEKWLQEGRPVFFFNGTSLSGGISAAVAADFAWSFNGKDSPIDVLKRLESFASSSPITIVVDAVDEWTFDGKVNDVGALLRAAENRNIRLVMSCKSSAVPALLTHRGIDTPIQLLSTRVDLEPFSPREFFKGVERYRDAYGFSGRFEDAVLKQAQANPFMLRVLFDVARNAGEQHLTFSSQQFFEAYYERAVGRTNDPERARHTLLEVARMLYELDAESVLEGALRSAQRLGVNEKLMAELFEFNILARKQTSAGSEITFYFQQLRDFIIAFHALRLPAMDKQALLSTLKDAPRGGVRVAVLKLYYRLTGSEHKRAFDADVRENALQYLRIYNDLIHRDFPALVEFFEPEGPGRTGFIGELMFPSLKILLYGFRTVVDRDDEVLLLPVDTIAHSNLPYLSGAGVLHKAGSNPGFVGAFDIEGEVRKNEVLRQLEKLVTAEQLNETCTPELAREKVVHAVCTHGKIFKSLLTREGSVRYPLKTRDIRDCLLMERLRRHFHRELIDAKRRSGEIQEHWQGTTLSYSENVSNEETRLVEQRAAEALQSGTIPAFSARYTDLEDLDEWLAPALAIVEALQHEITSQPAFLRIGSRGTHAPTLPSGEAKQRIADLYTAFLANYRTMVETNFPTLKQHFRLYARGPVTFIIALGEISESRMGEGLMIVEMCTACAPDGKDRVRVVKGLARPDEEFRVNVEGETYEVFEWKQITVGLEWDGTFGRGWRQSETTLRTLVYQKIREEYPDFAREYLKVTRFQVK